MIEKYGFRRGWFVAESGGSLQLDGFMRSNDHESVVFQ